LQSESFGELLDSISAGIVVYALADPGDDLSLSIVYANRAASQLLGMDLPARVGARLLDVFPASDPARVREYSAVCRNRVAKEFGRVLYGSSQPATFSVKAIPVLGDAVALVFENLTEQQRAEAVARASHGFVDSILEAIPAMIFLKEAKELRFERFNRAGEELLGLSRDTLIGKTDYDLFPREQADAFVLKDREVLARSDVFDIPEEPISTPRGPRWLHTRKIPLLDETGQVTHLLGISLDVTAGKRAREEMEAARGSLERQLIENAQELEAQVAALQAKDEALRRSEEQLRQSQKMEAIGRLAGGIAHDFNNLLSVITSYVALALEEVEEPVLHSDLVEVERAAGRAAALTRQLLAFSRQQVLEPKVIDLGDIVTNLERMLRRIIGEDIQLEIALAKDAGMVRVDPTQIEQVIMNLGVNAKDAMPGGGVLTIETASVEFDPAYAAEHPGVTAGPHVMLAVSDTGVGMDRTTQARIFDPFFTTKEQGKGTGLGLSTVFGIVKQSGGSIWVYSEVGRGATFKLYFPRAEAQPELRPSQASPVARTGSETILLVEDEESVRRVARAVLVRAGYHVLEAADCIDAARIAEHSSETIHLLITDVVMPDMSGPELARRIRVELPELKVLCMSGYTDETVLHHGVVEGEFVFLQKPITPDSLLRKVRDVLG
jgi:PAS domain S-box-containing protein